MKMRFLLCALILSIFMPVSSVFASYQANMTIEAEENAKYDYVVEFFTKIGVLDEDFAKIYEPEQPISTEIANEVFSRLTNSQINCESKGQYVTLKNVVLELVGVYNSFVAENYSQDVIVNEAERLGILDKLKTTALNKQLTAEMFVQLLYNTAYTQSYFTNEIYGESFMDQNGYREVKGVVTANRYTSLYTKDGNGEAKIEICGEKFLIENAEELLGYEVRIVVDEDDNVISYMLTNKNNVVEIISDKIGKASDTYFYYNEGNKNRKIRLNDQYIAIFNGVLRYRKDAELLRPEYGKLTFIDNNGDNIYDVLKTESYKVMRAESIDRDNGIIIDGNKGVRIELDNIDFDMYIDGERASIYDVPKNSVLYYGYSEGKKYVVLYFSTESEEGTIKSLDIDGHNTTLTIDGVTYPAAEEKTRAATVGAYVKIYMGAFGRVEYIEYLKGYSYGILKSIRPDMDQNKYIIKYLDETGEIVASEISERCKVYSDSLQGVKFNETTFDAIKGYIDRAYTPKASSDTYGYGMAAPIFMYRKVDDTIRLISLPQLYDENNMGRARKPYVLQSASTNQNMLYKSSENLFRNATKAFYATFRNASYCDNVNKFTNGDTIVFDLMINSDNHVDIDMLDRGTVKKASSLTMDPWCYGNFYNLNEANIAEVIVIYNLRQKSAKDGHIIVSKAVVSLHPETEDVVYKIEGFKGKTPVVYYLSEQESVINMSMTGFVGDTANLTPADIRRGDYMNISVDDNGVILYANVYARGKYSCTDYNLYHDSNNPDSLMERMFGKVKRISSGVITLSFDNNALNNAMTTYSYNTYQNGTIYIYDGETVRIGSASDICVGDYIYTRLSESSAQETIIWRKK